MKKFNHFIFQSLIILTSLVVLAGCTNNPPTTHTASISASEVYSDAHGHIKQPRAYTVRGKHYKVMASAHGYKARGVASWYGKHFQHKRTSSGERYQHTELTAAHKTLPLMSHVKVTNLANGKSVIVKINDRGPFVGNRLIDLSKAAAEKIGMLHQGRGLVEITSLENPPSLLTSTPYHYHPETELQKVENRLRQKVQFHLHKRMRTKARPQLRLAQTQQVDQTKQTNRIASI